LRASWSYSEAINAMDYLHTISSTDCHVLTTHPVRPYWTVHSSVLMESENKLSFRTSGRPEIDTQQSVKLKVCLIQLYMYINCTSTSIVWMVYSLQPLNGILA